MAEVSRMHFQGISGNVSPGWARSRWKASCADEPPATPMLAACEPMCFSPTEAAMSCSETLETILDGLETIVDVHAICELQHEATDE